MLLTENQQLEQGFGIYSADTTNIENPSSTINANDFSVMIAPNPVKSSQPVFVETTMETARALTPQIFETSGRLLQSWVREAQPVTTSFNLQPSLEKSLYLLEITDENGEGRAVGLVVY